MSTMGRYHDKCGEKYLEYRGVFSTVGDIMMHVGKYHEYCGEYHEYMGCSVPFGTQITKDFPPQY